MINEKYFRSLKYADDMAFVGLLQQTDPSDEAAYMAHAKALQTQCHISKLEVMWPRLKNYLHKTRSEDRADFTLWLTC